MAKDHPISWLDRGRRHAAQYGNPMEFSDPFVQTLVTRSVNAAFKCLPWDIGPRNLAGRQLRPQFFCVENSDTPSIFCNQDEEFYYIILNKNLVLHLYNLARQVLCMKDVLSFMGDPALERNQ